MYLELNSAHVPYDLLFSNVDLCVQRAWPITGILFPDGDAKPVVDTLEGGNACDTAAAACFGHRGEIEYFLDAGMEQCHGTHETGFVCDEQGQPGQEILRAVFGRFSLRRLDRWLLFGAIVCHLANDVQRGVAEGVFGGRTRVVREKRARELSVVLMGYRDVCDDAQLEDGR